MEFTNIQIKRPYIIFALIKYRTTDCVYVRLNLRGKYGGYIAGEYELGKSRLLLFHRTLPTIIVLKLIQCFLTLVG